MLAISTSFIHSWEFFGPKDLVDLLNRLAISAVELEYRIPMSKYNDLKYHLKLENITITSVHNYFPFIPPTPRMHPSGDLFCLSDLDPDKRKQAVAGTKRTIARANELEAGTVVLHCGRVEMDHQFQTIAQYLALNQIQSQASQDFIQEKLAELERNKISHISKLLFSLEALLRFAEKEGVQLALENRFHYYELPTFVDFKLIFDEFRGAPIGYWHDTGHAHALEKLTLIKPGALLDRYSNHLIGMHLHDAVGLNDHLAPGKGEIKLSEVLAQGSKDTILVMELKPGSDDADIRLGIEHLKTCLKMSSFS